MQDFRLRTTTPAEGPFAHSLPGRPVNEWELLATHLAETAELAAEHAAHFGWGAVARLAGLLHDLTVSNAVPMSGKELLSGHPRFSRRMGASLFGKECAEMKKGRGLESSPTDAAPGPSTADVRLRSGFDRRLEPRPAG